MKLMIARVELVLKASCSFRRIAWPREDVRRIGFGESCVNLRDASRGPFPVAHLTFPRRPM